MSADRDIALKRFDTMTRYYAFETTMYWTRSHFFMVANAGLLALAAAYLLEPNLDHPVILMLLCTLGVVLSIGWLQVLRSGQFWTYRWEGVCLVIEPIAMDQIEVFRNCRSTGQVSTKKMARYTAGSFIVVWLILFLLAFAHTSVGVKIVDALSASTVPLADGSKNMQPIVPEVSKIVPDVGSKKQM